MGLNCNEECGKDRQLQYFQKAIHFSSKLGDARSKSMLSDSHYRLALIYEEMGDQSKSLEFFRKVTELDHSNSYAFYKVGLQYFEEGEYEHARRYFIQSDRGRNRPDELYYYMAQIYDHREEYDLALQTYTYAVFLHNEDAVKIYPRLVEIYRFRNHEHAIPNEIRRLREIGQNNLADQLKQYLEIAQSSGPTGQTKRWIPKE